MPNPINVPITPPRVAFIDPRTGNVSREWYMFFLSLYQLVGGSEVSLDDVQKGPPTLTIDEVNHNINKATENLGPSQDGLLAQIAEMQKRIDALESAAAQPQLGTMAPMNKDFMDFIGFNQNAGHTALPGQMTWNSVEGCLEIAMGFDGVVAQIPLEDFTIVKATAAITNGQSVMFTGAVGASGQLTGAPATGITEGQYIIGIATMDIPLNSFGLVTTRGKVRGINTTGTPYGETWADGDILYYSDAVAAGGLTNILPTAPYPVVILAAVNNAGPGGSGSLTIRPTFMPTMAQLSNVYAPSPSDGDKLIYNGTLGRWEQDNRSYLMLE